MEIILAKTAGFCFGVDRAVNKVYDILKQKEKEEFSEPVYTYGEIIHNPIVVQELKEQGVKVLHDLDELKKIKTGKIIIRSHGVREEEVKRIESMGFEVNDCTCPYVKKIHRIVKKADEEGSNIIIIGNPNHPEVQGISGWTSRTIHYINSLEEAKQFLPEQNQSYCVVEQTTFNNKLYQDIVKELQKKSFHVMINETICQATMERQMEAEELAKKATKMIVIGGKESSNTKKLYEICKNQCKDTYYIETIEDLVLNVFEVNDIIGITAGASTPKNIIEEVISNVRNAKF